MKRRLIKIEATKKAEKKKINVAAYCRVSTGEESQLTSLSNQVSYYSELIQSNPDYNYAGCFIDEGISGTSLKHREGFKDLLKECNNGKVDLILVKSISRFARNTVDLLSTVRELKDKGIEVLFEKENISTMTKDGELMLSLMASFAQNESYSISENIKWGIKKNYEDGFIRKQRTYGYDIKNGKYIINERESKVIKLIFKWWLDGKPYAEISDILNAMNIPSSRGLKWSRMVVKKILNQEKYAGYALLQKSYVESPITHKEKKNNGEKDKFKVDGAAPAIINLKDFEKAQELRTTANIRVDRWRVRGTWITGLVRCPECGSTMRLGDHGTKLRCSNHDKHKGCKNGASIKIYTLESALRKEYGFKKLDFKVRDKIKKVVPIPGDTVTKFKFFT